MSIDGLDSLEKLEKEIAVQRTWPESLQKDFMKDCLIAQGGQFFILKEKDIEKLFTAYKDEVLGDESIQYYTRIYLEMVYDIL
jgi:hypothetical protein